MPGQEYSASGQADYCTNQGGHKLCYFKGPPAKDGLNAYRIYKQQVGRPGQVVDIVEQPCHGQDADCYDTPPLTWPEYCPPAPYVHQAPQCPCPVKKVYCPTQQQHCNTSYKQFKPLHC